MVDFNCTRLALLFHIKFGEDIDYNKDMLTGFPLSDEWKSRSAKDLLDAMRMNQYRANWPVALAALRQLWETGKVTKLETPFFEPFEKPVNK